MEFLVLTGRIITGNYTPAQRELGLTSLPRLYSAIITRCNLGFIWTWITTGYRTRRLATVSRGWTNALEARLERPSMLTLQFAGPKPRLFFRLGKRCSLPSAACQTFKTWPAQNCSSMAPIPTGWGLSTPIGRFEQNPNT